MASRGFRGAGPSAWPAPRPQRSSAPAPDAEPLLTVAAGAFEMDPGTIPNIVLSGFPTSRNSQFVVLLDDEVAGIFADLEDGMLTGELPPGTLTYDEG